MPDDNRFANIAVDDEPDEDADDASDTTDAEAVADADSVGDTDATADETVPGESVTASSDADSAAGDETAESVTDAEEPPADEPSADAVDAEASAADAAGGAGVDADAVDEPEAGPAADTAPTPAVDPADAGPAFPFDDVRQKAVYPRPESWDAREEALDFEVKRALRDHGVKDVTGREIDDAVARTVPEVTDRIVEKVLEARRRKFD